MTTPFTTFRFEVFLVLDHPVAGLDSPLCDAAFAECDGLEMTMEPKIVESATVTNRQQRLIGPMKYGQITLKRGMTSNLQLWQWFAQTRPGSVLTAHGHITMWDSDGTPAIQFTLQGCLPVKMRAPSLNAREGQIAIEELGLVCEQFSVSLPGDGGPVLGSGVTPGAGQSVSPSLSVGNSDGAGLSVPGGAGFPADGSL
jgi:phage tail-like protein